MNELEKPENYHSTGYQYTEEADPSFFDAGNALIEMIDGRAQNPKWNVRGAALRFLRYTDGHCYEPGAKKLRERVVQKLRDAGISVGEYTAG
jgi:hypothetical protein